MSTHNSNRVPVLAADWSVFLTKHRHRTVDDMEAQLKRLQEERGPQPPVTGRRRRRRRAKTASVADLPGGD